MGNRRNSLSIITVVAVGILFTVGACGAEPMPVPTGSPTRSATSTSTATPTPTPTATVEAAPVAPTCENIVTEARQSGMAAGGLTLFPSAEFFAKVTAEGRPGPYALFESNGGVVCAWSAGAEVFDVYGFTPLTPGQAGEMGALITASDPYASSEYAGGILYASQMDGNPFTYFLVTSDATYLASSMDALSEVMATAP